MFKNQRMRQNLAYDISFEDLTNLRLMTPFGVEIFLSRSVL